MQVPASRTVDWDTWFYAPGVPPVTNEYDTSLASQAYDLAMKWHTCDVMGVGSEYGAYGKVPLRSEPWGVCLERVRWVTPQLRTMTHALIACWTRENGGNVYRVTVPVPPAGNGPAGASAADVEGWSSEQVGAVWTWPTVQPVASWDQLGQYSP